MIRAAVLSVVLVVGLASTAEAELAGRALTVTGGCASGGSISIDPDSSLSGQVAVDGPAQSATGGSGGTITVMPSCGDDGLRVRVPPSFPVEVAVSGDRTVEIGDLAGPVSIVVTGSSISAGQLTGPVRIDGEGDGDITVASLAGPTEVSLRGSGDLAIGSANVPTLSISATGSGDVRIGGGAIAHLDASLRGSGDLRIGGVVGDGSVADAGDGDVSIDHVTGDLSEIQSGSGEIHVGSRRHHGGRHHVGPGAPVITVSPPAMPVINIQEPNFRFRADSADDLFGFLEAIAKLAVFAAVAVAVVMTARRVLSRSRRRSAPLAGATSHPSIAHLAERLERIARRTGALEQAVTSNEFDLDRQFRDIGVDRRA